jgi:hypothetical protein
MHNIESKHCLKMLYVLRTIEKILLGVISLLGTVEFIQLTSTSGIDEDITSVIIITLLQLSLVIILGIVIIFKDAGNYPDKTSMHNSSIGKFNEINLKIQEQLSLNKEDREQDKVFLQLIITEYNVALNPDFCPQIRESTMNRYIKATANSEIYKPIIIGKFENERIEIINDDQIYNVNTSVNTNHKSTNKTRNNDEFDYEVARYLRHF